MDEREIEEIRERIAKLESQMEIVMERLDRIENKVDRLLENRSRNNSLYKWITIWLVTILSFIAALFGIGWRPPS